MCPKCGTEEEMSFINVQTRSADEGESIYFTCLTCGVKFKL